VQLFAQAVPLPDSLHDPREWRLRNIRQLTFEGENAEAYFSFDERMLCFQSRTSRHGCDQIFIMDTGGTYRKRISPGLGRTTCAYFLPDGRLLYATTHLADSSCPPPPDYSQGYVWPVYPTYDIVIADTATGAILQRLTITDGYDAEATVSPTGDRIVFTSARDGDLELYSCALDGSDLRRLTFTPGYDGGAFFSFDGKQIVYRAHHPQGAELEEYRQLLRNHLLQPPRPYGTQLRPLHHQHRRHGAGAGHLLRGLRRLPHVHTGWEEARLLLQPQRPQAWRYQYLHRRLG
jgi:hypothetical protein